MRAAIPALLGLLWAAGSFRAHEVAAQSISSPYRFIEERQEAGVFAGYFNAKTGRFGYGPAGGLWVGGRYGLELAGPLSLEGVAGVISGTRDVISPGRPADDRVVGEADVLITTIDGRLKLSFVGPRTWHGLSPFLVAGGGVAWDVESPPEADQFLDSDEIYEFGLSFFGNAGLGTRWFVTDRFTVRTDALFSLWKLSTPVGYGDPQFGFGPVAEGEWVRGLSITGALLFRW